ncbi:MAG: N-acetylneuraminate synthase family protein putative legionaminic acid synthase LegI [Herbinix sp.]|jgi:N,N'-diacetyllegionaminate synthase|nr:N-acetylneuraminate synthase family protein putative legionaminic acid synthase LegI [Herbinix sp.]
MSKVYIIAEAGVNHNGDLELAKRLVDIAKDAGADVVKFQTFKAENLVCRTAPKADYQMLTTNKQESQFEMLKKLEVTEDMHKELISYCKEKKIEFMSTPFDEDSVLLLMDLGMETIKIPSGEITNYPYLKQIGNYKKKVIISTGMSNLDEVKEAVNILRSEGTEDISVLHCTTAYPTNMEDVNLRAMSNMMEELQVPVGYSDHTLGIEVPIAAVALGAIIIEKHFTIDKKMDGPDHKASLEPEELKAMIKAIRNIEKAFGYGVKKPCKAEEKNIEIARKSIVAKRDIIRGETLSEDNLITKRPANGISPMKWPNILGTKAIRDFKQDELIEISGEQIYE